MGRGARRTHRAGDRGRSDARAVRRRGAAPRRRAARPPPRPARRRLGRLHRRPHPAGRRHPHRDRHRAVPREAEPGRRHAHRRLRDHLDQPGRRAGQDRRGCPRSATDGRRIDDGARTATGECSAPPACSAVSRRRSSSTPDPDGPGARDLPGVDHRRASHPWPDDPSGSRSPPGPTGRRPGRPGAALGWRCHPPSARERPATSMYSSSRAIRPSCSVTNRHAGQAIRSPDAERTSIWCRCTHPPGTGLRRTST